MEKPVYEQIWEENENKTSRRKVNMPNSNSPKNLENENVKHKTNNFQTSRN